MDRKGHAKFFKMVTVYVQEGRTLVGVHDLKTGPRGASASMSAGDTRVDVVAAVDPKTGSVSLAMQEKKVPPALKAVKVKAEDPGVDVLPRQIFDMMVLPEGQMEPGKRVEVSTPMGPLTTTLSSLEGGTAQLRTTVAQRMDDPGAGTGAARQPEAASEDAAPEAMGGMNMGGMNMGGMNMGGMPSSAAGSDEGSAMGMKTEVDVTSGFDVAAGRLLHVEGTSNMEQSMGGSGMTVHSRFSLRRQ